MAITQHSEYQAAIDEFCADNPELEIYLAGEISHPGISDIDLIVLDREPVVSAHVEPFLQGGNVLVVPTEIFPMIDWIEKFDLKRIQGPERERIGRGQSAHFERYFLAVDIIEWLPERILKFTYGSSEDWTSRQLQLFAKSLDRSIKNVEGYLGYGFERVCTVESLRAQHEITHEDVRPLVMTAAFAWTMFAATFEHITGSAHGSFRLSDYYRVENAFELLMMYFAVLLHEPCELSERLYDKINITTTNVWARQTFERFILTRWRIIDHMHRIMRGKGVSKGVMKYGWLF